MNTVFLLLLAVSNTLAQSFIPTQYDTFKPQSYQAMDTVNYQAFLCTTSQYVGCTVNVTINLPHDPWDYIDGRFVQFSVFSDRDTCHTPLCSNNASATGAMQSSCAFRFTSDLSNARNLYIVSKAGDSPDIQATVNLIFVCPPSDPKQQQQQEDSVIVAETVEKREAQQSNCPITSTILKEVIQLNRESQVITAPDYADASKFFFYLCGDGVHRYQATAFTIGTTIDSAFATYVCQTTPCTPTFSPYFDASGTGVNTVVFQTSTPNPIQFYVSIYGWGKFHQWNFYRFGVNIETL